MQINNNRNQKGNHLHGKKFSSQNYQGFQNIKTAYNII